MIQERIIKQVDKMVKSVESPKKRQRSSGPLRAHPIST